MKAFMDKYAILISKYIKEYRKYPLGLFLKLIYLPVQMLMYVFLWISIGKSNEIDISYLISYYLLTNLLTCAYPFTHIAIDIESDVMDGGIANYLVRPYHYIIPAISKFVAWVLLYSVIFIPALIFIYVYRGLTLTQMVLFLLSALLGMSIEFMFWYSMGLISLFVERIHGIITTVRAVRLFVSGSLIPLSFFPEYIRKLTYFFPFRFYIYVPVNNLLADKGINEFIIDYCAGFLWLIFLVILSKIFFEKGIEKINYNIS